MDFICKHFSNKPGEMDVQEFMRLNLFRLEYLVRYESPNLCKG